MVHESGCVIYFGVIITSGLSTVRDVRYICSPLLHCIPLNRFCFVLLLLLILGTRYNFINYHVTHFLTKLFILSSLYLCAVSRDRGKRFDDKRNISSLLEEAHSWNEATMA